MNNPLGYRPGQGMSFEAVYRAERPRLIRYLMSLGAGQHQADDAVQAAFARAWDRWDTICYPRAWLYKVAIREYRQTQLGNREIPVGDALPETATAPDTSDLVVLMDQEEQVRAVLATLPTRQQQVMALAIAGFSAVEISGELGCEAAAVRQNQAKARRKLARNLGIDGRKYP